VTGFVNSNGEFEEHSQVVNGASQLLLDLFGPERGSHARSAVGCVSLPFNAAVEVEMIVEVKEDAKLIAAK